MDVAGNPHDKFACKTVKMFFYMEVKKHVPVNLVVTKSSYEVAKRKRKPVDKSY